MPTLDVRSAIGRGLSSDSCSTSLTVGSLTNGILIIRATYMSGTPQTPTVGGSTTGVTLLASKKTTGIDDDGVNIYYKLAPSAGSTTVAFQSTGASWVGVSAESYSDVNQTTPFGTPSSAGVGNGTSINQTIGCAIGDLLLDAGHMVNQFNGATVAPGSGQTTEILSHDNSSYDVHFGSFKTATATSENFSWSYTANSRWALIVVRLNSAVGVVPASGAMAGSSSPSFVGAQTSTAALAAAGVGTMAPVGADAQPPVQRYYMSKGDTYENDLLKLLFNATAIANIADNAASSPLTNLQVALHTADPGEAGSQTTNETAYTGYARVAVARTSGGWTVTGGSVSPAANIDFGTCTASPGSTITHASVGTASSGAGKLLYSGAISPQIAIAVGVIPRLTTATVITED